MTEVDSISPDLTDDQRQKVLWQNADQLYGLGLAAAVPA
jgi:predicted TIM-barrel fold metal-dependent hydrolase